FSSTRPTVRFGRFDLHRLDFRRRGGCSVHSRDPGSGINACSCCCLGEYALRASCYHLGGLSAPTPFQNTHCGCNSQRPKLRAAIYGVVATGLAMTAVVEEPVPERSCCRVLALIAVLIGAWTVELIVWKYAIALLDSTDTELET